MGYSEVMFDTVASLLVSSEQPKQSGILRGLDDYVIALSVDSAMPMDEVRVRLKERMQLVREGSATTSAV